jgi:hypothetical protein
MHYKVLEGKPEGKRPLGNPIRSWEISMEVGLREVEWIDLVKCKVKLFP